LGKRKSTRGARSKARTLHERIFSISTPSCNSRGGDLVGILVIGLGHFDRDIAFGFAHQARADHAGGEFIPIQAGKG